MRDLAVACAILLQYYEREKGKRLIAAIYPYPNEGPVVHDAVERAVLNPAASAYLVICCGVRANGEHYYSLGIEDSPQFIVESFNEAGKEE